MALSWTRQPYQMRRPPEWRLWQSKPRQTQSDDWDAPFFWILSTIVTGAACLFLLLHWLCQPTIIFNPGVAAYMAPPGTRLVPLPRQSDAPELADLPVEPPSPLTALAKAQSSDQQAKRDMRPHAHKRPRADFGEHDQRGFGFAPQFTFGPQGWNNNHWNNNNWNNNNWNGNNSNNNHSHNNHMWSGGPKSWF